MNRTDYQHIFKIIMIGGDFVGKSCLVRRYTEGLFPERILATIGIDFCNHFLEVEPGVRVKLQIFDTPGIELAWSQTETMVPSTSGCLLVFDLSDSKSFRYIKCLHERVCQTRNSHSKLFVLVGNKCDRKEQDVDQDELEYFESELGVPYFETSAKTGHNVAEAFELLTRRIYQGYLSGEMRLPESQGEKHENKTNKDEPAENSKCRVS